MRLWDYVLYESRTTGRALVIAAILALMGKGKSLCEYCKSTPETQAKGYYREKKVPKGATPNSPPATAPKRTAEKWPAAVRLGGKLSRHGDRPINRSISLNCSSPQSDLPRPRPTVRDR